MSELIDGRYVVGMTWSSIVGAGDPAMVARKKAQKDKATWYAHGATDKTNRNVGLAHLPRKLRPSAGSSFLSAARIAAAANPHGSNIYILRLPDQPGRVWVCGISEGVPYPGFDAVHGDIEGPQELDRFLNAMGIEEGQCGIHGDAEGLPGSVTYASWDEVVQVPGMEAISALKPTTVALSDVLTPQRRAAGMAVLALVGVWFGWGEYTKSKKRKLAAQVQASAPDPVAEWGSAMDRWRNAQRGPARGSLAELRRAMGSIDINVAGWDLQHIDCKQDLKGWSCTALYGPSKEGDGPPTTAGFMRARPQAWVVSPKSLQAIEASFLIPLASAPLRADTLQTVDWHMVNTVSGLQRTARAFNSVSLGAFQSAQIQPPVGEGGAPLPLPPGMPSFAYAQVGVAGPLRSLDLAEIAEMGATWDRAHIKVNLGGVIPSLDQSAVTVDLKGTIYARR